MRLKDYKKRLVLAIDELERQGKKTDYLRRELASINSKNPEFGKRLSFTEAFDQGLGNRYDSVYMSRYEAWSIKKYGGVVDKKENPELYKQRHKEFQSKKRRK